MTQLLLEHARTRDEQERSDAQPYAQRLSHADVARACSRSRSTICTMGWSASPPSPLEDLVAHASHRPALVVLARDSDRPRTPTIPAAGARARGAARPARSRSTATSTSRRGPARRSTAGFMQRFPKDGAQGLGRDPSFAILYDDERDLRRRVGRRSRARERSARLLTRRDVDAPADAIVDRLRQLSRSPHRLRVPAQRRRRAARHAAVRRLEPGRHLGRGVDRRRRGHRRRGWTAEFRIPLSQLRFSPATTPTSGASRSCARSARTQRAGHVVAVAAHARRRSSASSASSTASTTSSRRAASSCCRTSPAASTGMPIDAGDPLNDAVRDAAQHRPRSQVRPRARVHAVGDDQPGLRPGRGRSVAGQPVGATSCSSPRSGRSSSRASICSSCRSATATARSRARSTAAGSARAADRARRRLRLHRCAAVDDDLRRREADRQDRGGWSVGVLDAVTGAGDRPRSSTTNSDAHRADASSPLTNYAIARVKRDFSEGATSIGVSAHRGQSRARRHRPRRDAPRSGLHRRRSRSRTAGADNAWTAQRPHRRQLRPRHRRTRSPTTQQRRRPPVPAPRRDRRPLRSDAHEPVGLRRDAGWSASSATPSTGASGFGGDLRTPGPRAQRPRLPAAAPIASIPYLWAQYRDDDAERAPAQLAGQRRRVLGRQLRATAHRLRPRVQRERAARRTTGRSAAAATSTRGYWNSGALRGGPCAARRSEHVQRTAQLNTDHAASRLWFSVNGHTAPQLDDRRDRRRRRARRDDPGALERRPLPRAELSYERNDPMQYVDRGRRQRRHAALHLRRGSTRPTTSMTMRVELDVLAAPEPAGLRAAVRRDRAATPSSRTSTTRAPRSSPIAFTSFTGDEYQRSTDGTSIDRTATASSRTASTSPTSTSASCARRSCCAGSTARARRSSRSGATARPATRRSTAGSARPRLSASSCRARRRERRDGQGELLDRAVANELRRRRRRQLLPRRLEAEVLAPLEAGVGHRLDLIDGSRILPIWPLRVVEDRAEAAGELEPAGRRCARTATAGRRRPPCSCSRGRRRRPCRTPGRARRDCSGVTCALSSASLRMLLGARARHREAGLDRAAASRAL